MTDEQLAEIWKSIGPWMEGSAISPLLIKFGRAVATAAVEAERKGRQDGEALAQLRHLVDDLTHCPNADDPTRRYIKPGAGLMFSNMVNACASLIAAPPAIPEDRAALAERIKSMAEDMAIGVRNSAKDFYVKDDLAASPPPSAAPEGWQLVPKQWSSEMAHAGYLVYQDSRIACAECGEIYRAMIAAAPKEPT